MRCLVATFALAGLAVSAHAQSVAYISSDTEPWNQQGNVNALNVVFGNGNWVRTTFAAPGDTLGHDVVIMDGGNGASGEFEAFINANRSDMEAFVKAGGVLVVGSARWESSGDFDLSFGIMLHDGTDGTGTAVDDSHPVFDGPFGATGPFFVGDSLAHDTVSGDELQSLMTGDETGLPILGEASFGNGCMIAHGLTLPFFGEHFLWSENTDEFLRNLYAYAGDKAGDCAADVNGDGELNVLDFVAFQGLWQDQDPAGDCDGNGVYNILDFVCFQQLFVKGCE